MPVLLSGAEIPNRACRGGKEAPDGCDSKRRRASKQERRAETVETVNGQISNVISEEQARDVVATKWWVRKDMVYIACFQLYTNRLCLPKFGMFHEAVEALLNRDVMTTEFAHPETLKDDVEKKVPRVQIAYVIAEVMDRLCKFRRAQSKGMTLCNVSRWKIEKSTPDMIVIRDEGPWNLFKTVTNNIENVVNEISPMLLFNQRIFYYDSEGELAEIKHEGGKFLGFEHVSKDVRRAIID